MKRCCRRWASTFIGLSVAVTWHSALLAVAGLTLAACEKPDETSTTEPAPAPPSEGGSGSSVPEPDWAEMEPQVEKRLRQVRAAVFAEPLSAAAWGRFGMVAHAHELWDEATAAYRQAEKLDPKNVSWPYYLGDVLSIVGTDLEAAEKAFGRVIELQSTDYAPTHLRLGRVLFAAGKSAPAARALERALELQPDLQPARVTLAQIRLGDGEPERARQLLEVVLADQPRHAQALSTLGQVYSRLGKRDEAREIATRARDASTFNLFTDRLMSKVVAEGVSSVLIWERARAFLEDGNWEQAARGLRQVVKLQPGNGDAHQQLALAYGNLGDMDGTRQHLERAVALVPERVDARIQLATVLIDHQQPAAALEHLRKVQQLAPDDADARWLVARAQVLTGDVGGALASFEKARAAGGAVPLWARNEWGSALAQSGRANEALEQFRAVLAAEPDNAQALFYTGLILEGLGRIDEAVASYCRSMAAQPNPPAGGRLNALGRSCSR